MKITVILDRPVSNYEFAHSLNEEVPQNTFAWQDSNILHITNAGKYYIFVRNKISGVVESIKSIYLNCVGGELVCEISYTNVISINECNIILVKPILLYNVVTPKICSISYVNPISINSCYIIATSAKRIN
jgi:hypothetical protein